MTTSTSSKSFSFPSDERKRRSNPIYSSSSRRQTPSTFSHSPSPSISLLAPNQQQAESTQIINVRCRPEEPFELQLSSEDRLVPSGPKNIEIINGTDSFMANAAQLYGSSAFLESLLRQQPIPTVWNVNDCGFNADSPTLGRVLALIRGERVRLMALEMVRVLKLSDAFRIVQIRPVVEQFVAKELLPLFPMYCLQLTALMEMSDAVVRGILKAAVWIADEENVTELSSGPMQKLLEFNRDIGHLRQALPLLLPWLRSHPDRLLSHGPTLIRLAILHNNKDAVSGKYQMSRSDREQLTVGQWKLIRNSQIPGLDGIMTKILIEFTYGFLDMTDST